MSINPMYFTQKNLSSFLIKDGMSDIYTFENKNK